MIWNIQGARWEREWTMDPAGLHGRAAPPERLAELNAWRAEAIAPLSALRRGLRAAQNTGEMVLALYHFLEQTGLARAAEQACAGGLSERQSAEGAGADAGLRHCLHGAGAAVRRARPHRPHGGRIFSYFPRRSEPV